jgi:hypothetical protein
MMAAAWAVVVWAAAAAAEPAPLVLALGSNTASGVDLPALQFADDDAAAAVELFGADPERTWLLTTLDADSQERFPQLAQRARPPTLQELLRATSEAAQRVTRLQAQGEHPVVVVWLVGHGAFGADGQPFVALQDGALTQQLLWRKVLAPLAHAHRVHVVLDACHAEAMVRSRALLQATSGVEVRRQFLEPGMLRADNVGYLAAAGAAQKTFEWQEMRAGVFSALVRAGLRGAANANADGCVTYDEVAAFVTASLQGIAIPEARPRVTARPPGVEHGAPLACSGWFAGNATLNADMGSMGQVHVEDARGVWLAGGRFETGHRVNLWLPTGHPLVLRADSGEWPLEPSGDGLVALGPHPLERASLPRGAVERAMREGLFSVSFGPGFLRGFQARPNLPDAAPQQGSVAAPSRHLAAWASAPFLSVALVAAGVTMASLAAAVFSLVEYASTDLQRPAQIAATHVLVSVAVMAAAALLALLTATVGGVLLALDFLW